MTTTSLIYEPESKVYWLARGKGATSKIAEAYIYPTNEAISLLAENYSSRQKILGSYCWQHPHALAIPIPDAQLAKLIAMKAELKVEQDAKAQLAGILAESTSGYSLRVADNKGSPVEKSSPTSSLAEFEASQAAIKTGS